MNYRFNGQLLRRIREERKLSQADIGKMAGVSLTSISKIELGIHDPKFTVAARIARSLDMNMDDFILEIPE